jgi:hypothetical protein
VDIYLLIAGCLIFVFLGSLHLIFTLFRDSFQPRDANLLQRMREVSPKLTPHVSMWNAWVGFNISHSLCAIVFGLFYIVLAIENYSYLTSSVALNLILLAIPAILLATALKYWFYAPRNGIIAAFTLILASLFLRHFA